MLPDELRAMFSAHISASDLSAPRTTQGPTSSALLVVNEIGRLGMELLNLHAGFLLSEDLHRYRVQFQQVSIVTIAARPGTQEILLKWEWAWRSYWAYRRNLTHRNALAPRTEAWNQLQKTGYKRKAGDDPVHDGTVDAADNLANKRPMLQLPYRDHPSSASCSCLTCLQVQYNASNTAQPTTTATLLPSRDQRGLILNTGQ